MRKIFVKFFIKNIFINKTDKQAKKNSIKNQIHLKSR